MFCNNYWGCCPCAWPTTITQVRIASTWSINYSALHFQKDSAWAEVNIWALFIQNSKNHAVKFQEYNNSNVLLFSSFFSLFLATCDKPNEVYDVCPAPCPPKRCNVNEAVIKCAAPPKPGDPDCKPGCRCADNYYRNATGTCVLKKQCEKRKFFT